MNSDDIKVFFDLLNEDEYCLIYNGNFIDVVTSKIINITKVSLIQRGENIRIQNRLAYLIAECFQNIIRHGGHKEHTKNEEALPGFFMTKIKNNYYDVVTGNLIANNKVSALKTTLDGLNSLTRDELKALYNKTLAEGKLSEKGGAGLGLIDMVKKTAQRIEYEFLNGSDKSAMFYQRLVMASNNNIEERTGVDHNIAFGINLHQTMIDKNVLVLQKSDFSRESVLPMLNIVEENVRDNHDDTTRITIVYQILTNMIQTVNNHGIKPVNRREGIFFISKEAGGYGICSSCFIDSKTIKWVKGFVNKTAKMSKLELGQNYLNELKSTVVVSTEIQNVNPTDIGTIIKERFCFSFHAFDNQASLFNIHAII